MVLFDILDRVAGALAEVARLVAVAQLDRFMLAGGCAGGHGRTPHAAVGEKNIGFNGRVAAGVEDFATDDLGVSAFA